MDGEAEEEEEEGGAARVYCTPVARPPAAGLWRVTLRSEPEARQQHFNKGPLCPPVRGLARQRGNGV